MSNMVIALNVASTAAIVCSAPAVLTHVLEMVSADDWDATTVTYSSDSVIASTGSISFATDGYQSSTTSSTLRYFNVSTAAALDIVNANIQLNSGKLSFRLKRYCSSGSTVYTTPFYGISFAGTVVGNTTYFSLSPSYVFFFLAGLHTRIGGWRGPGLTHDIGCPKFLVVLGPSCRQTTTASTCSPHATCTGGACVCNPGYIGNGVTCTRTLLRLSVHWCRRCS